MAGGDWVEGGVAVAPVVRRAGGELDEAGVDPYQD